MKTRKLFTATLALLLALCTIAGGGVVQVAYAASNTIDLDEITANPVDGSDYTVDTTNNIITVTASDNVTIKGNGTNGGVGWSIVIADTVKDIAIESNTIIFSTSGTYAALNTPDTLVIINGKGSGISITGNTMGINAKGSLKIAGTIGSITATQVTGGAVNATGDIEIVGTIGSLSGSVGTGRGSIEISGTVGDVKGTIFANNDVEITGTVGNITATGDNSNGIAGKNVEISGKTGNISGGGAGIFATDNFTVSNNSVVNTSGLMTIDAGNRIPLDPNPASQGILFVGNSGTVYGDVTLEQNLTVNNGQTLTVPNGASLTIPSGVTLTNSGRIQNNGGIRNNGRINSIDGGFRGTSPTGNPVQYPQPSSGSGSSSSGGGTMQTAPAIPTNTPQTVTLAAANTATQNAIAAARAAGSTIATVNFRNPGEISLSTLQAMTNTAHQAGMTLRLQADSMTADNRAVDVRISLDPTLAKTGLNLSASTTNTAATKTTSTFMKFFENDVMTVALGQKAGFGQQVRIAAKLDPKLKTDNLVFYIFDPENNNFQRIPEPKYYVDKNGYVHFTTATGGSVVISDGPLPRR